MEIKQFIATKAFIEHNGKILILRESPKYQDGANVGKFDVVGGRVKPGEHFKESLQREIQEETGLDVDIGEPFFVNEWRPIVRGEQWQIIGIFFRCKAHNNTVAISNDHNEFLWINPQDFKQYPLIENLHPAFEEYLKR